MHLPAEIIIHVSKLSHDGRGLGFINGMGRGRAVFIRGALPGQTVTCRITAEKKNFLEGVARAIVETPELEQPLCEHLHQCGGCPLQLMPYSQQIFWKSSLAKESFQRIGGVAPEALEQAWHKPLPSPLQQSFRNKVELAFGTGPDGRLTLGYRGRGAHEVFNLKACGLIEQTASPIIAACREFAANSGYPAYSGTGFWRFLIMRKARTATDNVSRWHAIVITSIGTKAQRKLVEKCGQRLLAEQPHLGSFTHEERNRRDFYSQGERRIISLDRQGQTDQVELRLGLGGRDFAIDPVSFFQVNSCASERLAGIARQLDHKSGPLLDLYCGSGAPGQLLQHETCLGIEADKRAISFCRTNAELGALRSWRYQCCDAGGKLAALANGRKRWETVLLDPPRDGLGSKTIASLLKLKPERVIYISCNPATMARDARLLDQDYQIASLNPVDMFPHTPHLECAGLWQRRQALR